MTGHFERDPLANVLADVQWISASDLDWSDGVMKLDFPMGRSCRVIYALASRDKRNDKDSDANSRSAKTR
jgi:hypothetical protein